MPSRSKGLSARGRRDHLKKCAKIFKDLDDITDPDEEEARMLMRMQYFGLQPREFHLTGSCIYRSLSYYFFGTAVYYMFIWQAIIYQLNRLARVYCKQVVGDFSDYVQLVMSGKIWGDNVVAQAAADLFNIKIVVAVGEKENCFYEFLPCLNPYRRVVYLCAIGTYVGDVYPLKDIPPETKGVNNPLSYMDVDPETMIKTFEPTRVLEFCGNMYSYLRGQEESVDHLLRQQARLNFFGFELRRVSGKGNCVYHTISDQVLNDENHQKLVRKSIRCQLEEKPIFYQSQVRGDFFKYCRDVSIDEVWGDYTTLQAACDAFRVKFFVLGTDHDLCIREFCPSVGSYKKVLHATTAKEHMDSMYRVGEIPMEADSALDYLTLLEDDD